MTCTCCKKLKLTKSGICRVCDCVNLWPKPKAAK